MAEAEAAAEAEAQVEAEAEVLIEGILKFNHGFSARG